MQDKTNDIHGLGPGHVLGETTGYVSTYTPELLQPIARQQTRAFLGLEQNSLPFTGVDVWTGYELSWLDARGKPQVAVATFAVPVDSDCIIESKSFKLYLNSFNQSRYSHWDEVLKLLQSDLSRAAGARVDVELLRLERVENFAVQPAPGILLDDLPVTADCYHPAPELLQIDAQQTTVQECLYSNLLRSNCPVTSQPDWGTVVVKYEGSPINREALLKYIISFREHQDFHEHCVERMFVDIQNHCKPQSLTVYARYTRRGGLDINPYRSSDNGVEMVGRLVRQ